MIRSGDLDHKATIQTPEESQNAVGETVLTWSTFATRWVNVLPLSGTEQLQAAAAEAMVTHRIRMRYTEGLKPKMRLLVDGRTFEIMSVLERGMRREEHELMVSEVTD